MQGPAVAEPDTELPARTRLNDIADGWTPADGLPDTVALSYLEECGIEVLSPLGDHIETYEADTSFTRREAEAWALRHYIDEQHCQLTEDAVAITLTLLDSWEACPPDAPVLEAPPDDWVTPEEAGDLLHAAERKYDQARALLETFRFPDRDEVLDSPRLVWLDDSTLRRLAERRKDDETMNAQLDRMLRETERSRTLKDFIQSYLAERGEDNVVQVAVDTDSLRRGLLILTAHTGYTEEVPDVVRETDVITVLGERFDFIFTEDPWGPHGLNRISLYADDGITGVDRTPLEAGIEDTRQALKAHQD